MASALRESVKLEMRLRGFSPRTHESYIHALVELAKFCMPAVHPLGQTQPDKRPINAP